MNYKKTIRDFEKNYDKKKVARLKDFEESFLEVEKEKRNEVIYEVFVKKFSPINLGLTVVNPGTIGKEFYMTHGHVHKKLIPEFYILLEGKGVLLIQKGKPKTIELKKGEIKLIPIGYAHRLINTGKKKLKVLTIYHEDSRPSYNVKFKKRFFRK